MEHTSTTVEVGIILASTIVVVGIILASTVVVVGIALASTVVDIALASTVGVGIVLASTVVDFDLASTVVDFDPAVGLDIDLPSAVVEHLEVAYLVCYLGVAAYLKVINNY